LLDSLNDSIRRHLADNIWIYLIIIIAFILGISLGAVTVNNLDEVTRSDAKTYIEGFLELTSGNELQSSQILRQSIKFNLYFTMLLFLSGLIYLGVIFIPLLVAFRGFCIGFSVAFLSGNIGSGGLLLSIGSVLPQNIIYIPVIIIMGAIGVNYSLRTLRNKYFKKYGAMNSLFAAYAFTTLILFILLLAGCIVESYITALIIKSITPYVI
jgi:stage II sporulation protein M